MARDYELETDNLSEHFGAGTTWGVIMGFGPIEVIVVVFEGNEFTGEILPELRRLVDAERSPSSMESSFARMPTVR